MRAEHWCELFSEHLRVLNYSEATVQTYRLEVRSFCEFLDGRGVEEPSGIRRDDVLSYQILLHHSRKANGEPLKASSQSNKLSAVVAFLRYLFEEKLVLSNPAQDLRRPRVPDSLPPDVPDEEQVMRLLNTPDTKTVKGLRDRAILEVLYATAIRNAELRALRLEDVDLHRLELRVRCGKGGKGRQLPLAEPVAAWVEEYLHWSRPALVRNPSEESLFLNVWGGPLKADVLCSLVRRNAKASKIGVRVTAHVLRHACATHMLARKAGLRHLQQLLGHKDASSTERYTRVEVSDLREVLLQCHPRENS